MGIRYEVIGLDEIHLRWPARSLDDVQVLCRRCNSRKGPIRGRVLEKPIRASHSASEPFERLEAVWRRKLDA